MRPGGEGRGGRLSVTTVSASVTQSTESQSPPAHTDRRPWHFEIGKALPLDPFQAELRADEDFVCPAGQYPCLLPAGEKDAGQGDLSQPLRPAGTEEGPCFPSG